jgi:hypothetical protein
MSRGRLVASGWWLVARQKAPRTLGKIETIPGLQPWLCHGEPMAARRSSQ